MNKHMQVIIDRKHYIVNTNEFNLVTHHEYNHLKILEKLGLYDRIVSLIKELGKLNVKNVLFFNVTHGGYVPIKCSNNFEKVFVHPNVNSKTNIQQNISDHIVKNVEWELTNVDLTQPFIIFAEKIEHIDYEIIQKYKPILITNTNIKIIRDQIYDHVYELENTMFSVYIPNNIYDDFHKEFYYFINETTLTYDNLIHLCVMVKNGGDKFETMLNVNLPFIDRWTILDTGSTDNTIEIINRVLVGKKKGTLHQKIYQDFNFRDSRNELLELAGEECTYAIMLDDTYQIVGDLRGFLTETRGDQYSDSFSLYLKSDDVEYSSNRITKTYRKLKYKYRIHEIIQEIDNVNVIIPIQRTHIYDEKSDYMNQRTMNRKGMDLKLLYQEIKENPNDSRSLYYLGQTYNLLEDHENAYKYFIERMNHPHTGFIQEKIDAIFEAARLANFQLGRPWEECEKLYLTAYNLDKSRPDAIYFLGVHYDMEGDKKKAFEYYKKAYEIGYPVNCQYSLKPTLSYIYLPKMMAPICYEFGDYKLGEEITKFFLDNNTDSVDEYSEMISWYKLFVKINESNNLLTIDINNFGNKQLLTFVAEGGFDKWTGSDILVKGLGGSETYIVEMARYIQKHGYFKVFVFCNCEKMETFEGVEYIPIKHYPPFVKKYIVHTSIVSRFSEYLPVSFVNKVLNVYFVLHDTTPSGIVVPIDPKLRQIFCLTKWHIKFFTALFASLKSLTVPFFNGIDMKHFTNIKMSEKDPYKFIYSSFPNRGLLPLLQLWPKIVEKYPKANLHVYSDIYGEWVNNVESDLMKNIEKLLIEYNVDISGNTSGDKSNPLNIYCHGWVDKKVLSESWRTSSYWLYPCTFMETFCITALEAAASKTLAITTGLAALEETVGDRGICVKGIPTTEKWQKEALEALIDMVENKEKREAIIEKNYEWGKNLSWENQANLLLKQHILNKPNTYINVENTTGPIVNNNKTVNTNNNNTANTTNNNQQPAKDIFKQLINQQNYKSAFELLKNIIQKIDHPLKELVDQL